MSKDDPAPSKPGSKGLLGIFSSLKLTVWLLALGVAVVFFGTLAQTDDGLYVAQQKYFRSWASIWSPKVHGLSWIMLPLPGGYLLGTLLLINLAAAHYVRFKFTWRKSGILLAHFGIILLLVGQLATDMLARESRMTLSEGEWKNYSEDFQKTELAIMKDLPDPAMQEIVVVPESALATGGEITVEQLPFTLTVEKYSENSLVRRRGPMVDTNTPPASTQGAGALSVFEDRPPTRESDSRNLPAAVIHIRGKDGKDYGSWLVSLMLREQPVMVGGSAYRLQLRSTRYYQPFSIKLLKATHEVYAGTETPKNFQSRVVVDRPGAERREVDIYMNNPLRYGGLTFFQYQMPRIEAMEAGQHWSVLQVVKNPSWLTPYAGCGLVAAGMVVQFAFHLTGFLKRRVQKV
jgi:ResB-like family